MHRRFPCLQRVPRATLGLLLAACKGAKKPPCEQGGIKTMVEMMGLEPTTSTLRTWRSPS